MVKSIRSLQRIKKNIMVIGDAMLDRYVFGNVMRVSPEAPCPILDFSGMENQLGGASNVAVNLAAMNQKVFFFSVVGEDKEGVLLEKLLQEKNITNYYLAKDATRRTTIKTRIISDNHHMLRIDQEDIHLICPEVEKELLEKIEVHMEDVDVVVLSDYKKGLLTPTFTKAIIALANQKDKKVLVDLKSGDVSMFRGAYLVKPNKAELKAITKREVDSVEDFRGAMRLLKEQTNCSCVLATKGSEGMTLLNDEDEYIDVQANVKQVYDVTGAGDMVISYMAMGTAYNIPDLELLTIANTAASIKVSKFGTNPVMPKEVEQALRRNEVHNKIVTMEELMSELKDRKQKKIVFTNGCFDILHNGHIQCLKKAKKMGDILVVAVNSDESVRRFKGAKRPLNCVADRMQMLEALECTDYVVKFEEDTPYDLIEKIRPDVIVKGSDYKPEQVVGGDIVRRYGGKVVLVDLVKGKSTTNLIRLAQSR